MTTKFIMTTLVFVVVVLGPGFAQGFIGGTGVGIVAGGEIVGSIGAFFGGAVGAAAGTVDGVFGIIQHPCFRAHVRERSLASGSYDGESRLSPMMTSRSRHRGYGYSVASEQVLLIDPKTGHIVDVID